MKNPFVPVRTEVRAAALPSVPLESLKVSLVADSAPAEAVELWDEMCGRLRPMSVANDGVQPHAAAVGGEAGVVDLD